MLPGSPHAMVAVAPGDVFRAEFAHLGPVTVRFSKGRRDRAAEWRNELIAAEREHKAIGSSPTPTRTSTWPRPTGRSRRSSREAGGRRALRRLEARADQPQQAAGDGRRRAAVRAGHQRDARHLRRAGAPRPVHPPTGRERDRVPPGARRRGARHRDLGARRHRRRLRSRGRAGLPLRGVPLHAGGRRRGQRQRGRVLPRPGGPAARRTWSTCGCSAVSCGWTARWR